MDRESRARNIRLIIFDVDGVLTAGHIFIGSDGELIKQFHAQDGMGITAAHLGGLKTAIITGRKSPMVERRSQELKIGDVYQGAANKLEAFHHLLEKYQLQPAQVAYVGDDLNDLPVMAAAGLACAPVNAVPEVKEIAHFVAQKEGGSGAVREIIEYLLKAQGKWTEIVEYYRTGSNGEIRQ